MVCDRAFVSADGIVVDSDERHDMSLGPLTACIGVVFGAIDFHVQDGLHKVHVVESASAPVHDV